RRLSLELFDLRRQIAGESFSREAADVGRSSRDVVDRPVHAEAVPSPPPPAALDWDGELRRLGSIDREPAPIAAEPPGQGSSAAAIRDELGGDAAAGDIESSPPEARREEAAAAVASDDAGAADWRGLEDG